MRSCSARRISILRSSTYSKTGRMKRSIFLRPHGIPALKAIGSATPLTASLKRQAHSRERGHIGCACDILRVVAAFHGEVPLEAVLHGRVIAHGEVDLVAARREAHALAG